MDYFVKGDGSAETLTNERCHITELCNTAFAPGASLAIARVEVGVGTALCRN